MLATVSVALVAVAVGLRLLDAHMNFHAALFVLVLAPEAYLPLRALGANFHASADGIHAAEQVFELLETPVSEAVGGSVRPQDTSIRITGLEVNYPGRRIPALHGADLVVEPGEIVALTGPSGCGKSTLLEVVLGLRRPGSGRVLLGEVDLLDLDLGAWRASIGWVPQRPHLFARSVADNVRVGRPGASHAEVTAALEAAGLASVVRRLPHGVDTRLGDGGAGLSWASASVSPWLAPSSATRPSSSSTSQRPAWTPRPRPTWSTQSRGLTEGRTALIVAHRPALAALADRVVLLPLPVVAP